MNSNSKIKQFFKMTPAKYILLGFAALILIGAVLLCLPISNVEGRWLPFVDAFFTSTASVCVTGFMVFDIAAEFTLFGELVVLFLIQIGGLGFVTMASFVFMLIGKKIDYQTRISIQSSLSKEDNVGVVKTVKQILLITFICEFAGFLMLSPSMIKFTGNFWSGCYKALFLSISAFCNAGIDPLGTSTASFSNLAYFASDPFVLIPVMLLVFVGGIGFVVILDIFKKPAKNKKLTLHSRIALWVSLVLIVFGASIFMIAEWNNAATIGSMSTFDKITNSFFQSITTRSSGFTTFSQAAMTDISYLTSVLLILIGGSPVAVSGGIKTTTFFILLLLLFKNQDQNGNIIYRGKKITHKVITKAVRILLIAILLLIVGSMLIYVFEGGACTIDSVVYEVVSAVCTAGLSFGITPTLSVMSKLVLVTLMYVGRIGMLTIPLAFKTKETNSSIEYVSAKIIVG